MLYTTATKAALKVCYESHAGQVDKSGIPYVFHPFHLAEQMEDEESTCVALLHDVMEDTEFTVDDIRALGMPETVIEALELLTHDEAEPYLEYVARVARNPLAAKVKRADLLQLRSFAPRRSHRSRSRPREEIRESPRNPRM